MLPVRSCDHRAAASSAWTSSGSPRACRGLRSHQSPSDATKLNPRGYQSTHNQLRISATDGLTRASTDCPAT